MSLSPTWNDAVAADAPWQALDLSHFIIKHVIFALMPKTRQDLAARLSVSLQLGLSSESCVDPPTPVERNLVEKQPLVKMNIKISPYVAFSPYREIWGGLRN